MLGFVLTGAAGSIAGAFVWGTPSVGLDSEPPVWAR